MHSGHRFRTCGDHMLDMIRFEKKKVISLWGFGGYCSWMWSFTLFWCNFNGPQQIVEDYTFVKKINTLVSCNNRENTTSSQCLAYYRLYQQFWLIIPYLSKSNHRIYVYLMISFLFSEIECPCAFRSKTNSILKAQGCNKNKSGIF